MNRKQADNIINLIQKNINTKKEEVEKVYNQDAPKAPDFSSKKVENEFSLLGKMKQALTSDITIQQALQVYLKSKKYNDSNIRQVARDNNSKIKSIKDLENEITKLFISNGVSKKYNRFIFETYINVRDIANSLHKVDTTPKTLLDLINKNRNEIGLDSVSAYDEQKVVLSSYALSKTVVCDKNVDLDALTKNVAQFAQKYKSQIEIPSNEEGFLSVIRPLYNIIAENIIKDETVLNAMDNYESSSIAHKFANLSAEQQLSFNKSFTSVLTLLLLNRTLALTLENKEDYIQISKVIRYDICNQLVNVSQMLNDSAVIYALAKFVEDGFVEICGKLGLKKSSIISNFEKNGVELVKQSNIAQSDLALLGQIEETNTRQLNLEETINIDFKEIKKEGYYINIINRYVNSFNKLLNEKKFVPNVKIDIKAEDLKIQSIFADAENLIGLIESKNAVTNEQFKVFVDAHAYAIVSNEVLAELSKKYFNVENIKEKQTEETTEIVISTQNIINQPTRRLIENNIQTDTHAPAVRPYVPNFVILNESVNTKAENKDVVNEAKEEQKFATEEKVIEVEAVEHKDAVNQNNKNVVEPKEEKVETPKKQETTTTQTTTESVKETSTSTKAQPKPTEQKVVTPNAVETDAKKKHYVSPIITVKEQQKHVQDKQQEKVTETKVKTKQEKVNKVAQKPQSLVKDNENKMNEDNQKLNAELEKQKQEIEMLKKQLAQAQKQNATKQVDTVSKDEKVERLKDKIQIVLTNAFKKSASNLANKNLVADENNFINSILHFNKTSNDTQFMASSLNMLFVMGEGDTSVRNMFVAMNKAQVAKNLMKLKGNLEKLFVSDFAEKLAKNAVECGESSFPAEVIVNKAIKIYCEKYVKELDYNRRRELKLVIQNYGEDSFEYEDAENIINKKYFGEDGLLTKLDNSRLALITQDIIISQINEIDYAEANGLPYVFGKEKIDSILNEIVGNNANQEEHTF